jgi:hypothetical protein
LVTNTHVKITRTHTHECLHNITCAEPKQLKTGHYEKYLRISQARGGVGTKGEHFWLSHPPRHIGVSIGVTLLHVGLLLLLLAASGAVCKVSVGEKLAESLGVVWSIILELAVFHHDDGVCFGEEVDLLCL